MSRIPTIRVKVNNPANHDEFLIRNTCDLKYGEVLFKSEEFESLGEHEVRLRLELSPPDEYFVAEAKLWLELKSKERLLIAESARSARETETLAIAKEANQIASDTAKKTERSSRINRWIAITAIIIATIAATPEILSIIKFIFSFIKTT